MDYEKKIRDYMNSSDIDTLYKSMLNNLFPELAESEDEKIRKEIMDFIDTKTIDSDERRNRWFSYLEKYKPISFTSLEDTKVKMSLIQYISELNQDVVHLHPGIETCNEWIAWLEKQGEQKSLRMVSAEAKEAMYSKPTDLEVFINELSKQFPDVSFAKLSRIAVRVAKWVKPTDEEMKELLHTEYEKGRADAIAEMQKSTWSEEDECYMSECINALATKDSWSFEEKRKTKHWLKSLKERYTWKPSEEQLDALKRTQTGVIQFSVLQNLYNDLKKL